jgi:hypothetical protein
MFEFDSKLLDGFNQTRPFCMLEGSRTSANRPKRMTQARNWNHECQSCSAKLLFVRVKSLFSQSERAYCFWCGSGLEARDGEYLLQYTLVDRPLDDRLPHAARRVTEQWL